MSAFASLHGYVLGFIVIGTWATLMFWALALRFTSYEDTPTFWRAVSFGQIVLSVQLLFGVVLYAWWAFGDGALPGDGGAFQAIFHPLYGFVFPMIVLVVGHRVARSGQYRAHAVFAVVGLVIFGLTARAWQVGAGFGG